MKKGRELKNLPVIEVSSGQLLGYVREIEVKENSRLSGLYVTSLSNEICYVPWDNIASIGRDAIFIKSKEENQKVESVPVEKTAYCGSWVMSASGKNLGTIEDIVIEESSGNVVGYEISDGYLKDFLMGRSVIAQADVVTYGDDVFIVAD
ncbi:MAG: hypothetical protein JG781_159 [Peptococcaceae bacterium]|jgi:uncharacterized protein YrrD|nr:hypothetical protein [Peptococcaceae bacterium]